MSNGANKKSETEIYSKLMNQSLQSNNTKDSSSLRKSVRLRSNTIFAFQDDNIYSNIYTEETDETHSNYLTKDQNDTYYIPKKDILNSSNFFSTVCDRSQVWFNLNNTTTEKNAENDLESSIASIADEMEKNFGFLNDVEDDLNDAKLSLNENDDLSITSEKSNPFCHPNMNMTTPVNTKLRSLIQSEDMRNMNTYGNTQHSFSSSLTNQNLGTSNCSSMNDDKRGQFPTNINSYSTNNNIISNEFHNSHELISGSPYRLSYNSMNNTHINKKINMFPFVEIDPYQNLPQKGFFNPYAYSFCSEFIPANNNFSRDYKQFIPPMRFNPNEDKTVLDNLLILIKDQNGCRMIQKKLEEKKEDFISKFFEKIKSNIFDIICDQFGNYVIQKFLECCGDKKYTKRLIQILKNKLFALSTNLYGTRGFQKIIENLWDESDYETLKEQLQGNILKLIKDSNGNHVVQKILQIYPAEKNRFVVKEIIDNILEISKLKQGGCIYQKALEKAVDEDKVRIGNII